MIECSICGGKTDSEEATVWIGDRIVCQECFSSPTIRDVLICELEEAQAPLCWVCGGDLDRVDPGVHVGDWLVCARCYAAYEAVRARYHKAVEDPHDWMWLMDQDREAERFAGALREEREDWLSAQVAPLELERGGP